MTKPTITVIDYGLGNLFSVSRAIEYCGGIPEITSDPACVRGSQSLILPGVGAFGKGMENLRERRLDTAIKEYVRGGRPLLGICLGMQLLFDESEEFGRHAGLGLIPGRVLSIPTSGLDGRPQRVPHVGWAEIAPARRSNSWSAPILDGVPPGVSMYFVHSFYAACADAPCDVADCQYGGHIIPAVVRDGLVSGCQFHPEKSGPAGLKILANFMHQTVIA